MPVICLAAALAFAPRDPGAPPRQASAPAPEELPAPALGEVHAASRAAPAADPTDRPSPAPGKSDAR
jgi:hypothetical protein